MEDQPSLVTNIEQVIIGQLSNLRGEIASLDKRVALNDQKTDMILEQTRKTNGSVADHQNNINRLINDSALLQEFIKEKTREIDKLKTVIEIQTGQIQMLSNWRWWVLGFAAAVALVVQYYFH